VAQVVGKRKKMYVYIKDNAIEAITPSQLAPRDGVTELDIPNADIELTNNLQYLVYENGTVERREHTQEEFQTLTEEHRADPGQYATKRKREYPSTEEQLDYIYHNGVDAWKADIIDPIKSKYPKPE
jgi:hypothetical protein